MRHSSRIETLRSEREVQRAHGGTSSDWRVCPVKFKELSPDQEASVEVRNLVSDDSAQEFFSMLLSPDP